MITTEFYPGQGLGNQLWCYVTTRVIALDHGYEFGITSPEYFKAANAIDIDMGKPISGIRTTYSEQAAFHPLNGTDIRIHDKNLTNVADNTKLDGVMQDENYILHRKDEIRTWFKIEPDYDSYEFSSPDICIINFRGTGFTNDKDLFLPPRYWQQAIANMRTINPNFKFVVITEDTENAKRFFPEFEVYHFSIGKDFAVIKNAHYLILSNSTFAWFPAWISTHLTYCIAPKYWSRHNTSDGFWSLGYNITRGWMYQDRKGTLFTYEQCMAEHTTFIEKHTSWYKTNHHYSPNWKNTVLEEWRRFRTIQKDFSFMYALCHVFMVCLIRSIKTVRNTLARPRPQIHAQIQLAIEKPNQTSAHPPSLRSRIKDIVIKQGYY